MTFGASKAGPNQYVAQVDQLVMEYLLFRGFNQTFQTFNFERQRDNVKGFNVEKIIELIEGYITSIDISAFLKLWEFLDARFFAHLDGSYNKTIREFEVGLKRYYLVQAIQAKQMSKVAEFFDLYADQLVAESKDGWNEWFKLPFLKNPAENVYFKPYFQSDWSDALFVSLRNFLSLLFRNMPLPKMLAFPLSRLREQALQTELGAKESELKQLNLENIQLHQKVSELRTEIQQFQNTLQRIVRQINRENFTNVEPIDPSELHLEVRKSPDRPETTDNFKLYAVLEEHSAPVTNCNFSLNGQFLATGSDDATTRLWSIKEGKVPFDHVVRYCSASVLSMAWTVSKTDDQLLLYGTSNRNICVWNASKGEEIITMQSDVQYPCIVDLACSPSSSMFVCALASRHQPHGALMTWDLATGQVRHSLPIVPQTTRVNALSLNRDGTRLLAGSSDGMIRLYDLRQSRAVNGWQAHENSITEVQFTQDEKSLLSVSTEDTIVHWDLRIGCAWGTKQDIIEEFKIQQVQDDRRRHISFDKSGKMFLSSSSFGNAANLFTFRNSNMIGQVSGHNASVYDVSWHPTFTHSLCATASGDCTVRLWKYIDM